MHTRRALLRAGGLGTLAAIAAACSSSTPSRHTSVATSATATSAPPSTAPPSTAASSPAASSSALPTGRVVDLGARHVAAGDAISAADARRFGPLIGGRWRGTWRDTAGGSGTSDLLIAVDPRHRTVRATIDVGGSILGNGSSLAPITYEIDLLGFAKDAAAWTLTSPQLGKVVATAGGGTTLAATATEIPGHRDIAAIDITGTRVGKRVDGRYTITGHDGTKTTGTMAWTSDGQRGVATDPKSTAFNSISDVMGGQYAASFGTGSELSAAMRRETLTAIANGGRIGYQAGIDVSDANAFTADGELVIQYSVYRGASAVRTAAFWHGELSNQPRVRGPWTAAFFQGPGAPTLYAYRGSRVLIVNITPTVHAKHPPAGDTLQPMVLAVAKALMPKLNSR
jgi:hypothetical protein